jgi:hypothetical protein
MNVFFASGGLGGVIVVPPPAPDPIILDNALIKVQGNSQTLGTGGVQGAASNAPTEWPYKLQVLLNATYSGVEVENWATAGWQTPALISEFAANIGPIEEGRPNYYLVWEINNHLDIGGASVSGAIDSMETLIGLAKTAGYIVGVLCPIYRVPLMDTPTEQHLAKIDAGNAQISATKLGADFAVRLDLDPRLMDYDDPAYFGEGQLHINDGGKDVVAEDTYETMVALA